MENKDESTLKKLGDGAKKVWNKTVFPDMIKEKKEKKAAERELRKKAREEAIAEAGPLLKEKYKQEELDKILGNKKSNGMEKLAKGFGAGQSNSDTGDKISKMLGTGGSNDPFGDDKISKMLGLGERVESKKPRKTKQTKEEKTPEDRIARMLR